MLALLNDLLSDEDEWGCECHKTKMWNEHNAEHDNHGHGGNDQANGHKMRGVFKNGLRYGYFDMLCPAGGRVMGEFMVKQDGKSTVYDSDGCVYNKVFFQGKCITSEEIDAPAKAWFGDGQPFVVDPNHHH